MTKPAQNLIQSNLFKVAVSFAVVWGVITIARYGYQFGQYLYGVTH